MHASNIIARKKVWTFLYCCFFLFANTVAQNRSWNVSGIVSDSATRNALSYVLIYATPDTSDTFLSYTNTDENGKFDIKIDNRYSSIRLKISYLGYSPQEVITSKYDNAALNIYLTKKDNNLREVVVSDKRPPVIQKSDTTIYDLKQFRDSTEYNVEDLLAKLPGVEVNADGSIKVNGKNIDKVLIEGADLFGRKYTLGTKNIRAEFIEKVEVIDHYQENPVLKNVNISDAVVLNLLIHEDKKNIISGALNGGAGIGIDDELKGALHVNIFSVSKKSKFILLSDNGNTGTQYGISELSATYGSPNSKDIKNEIRQYSDYQHIANIQNPGLPSIYINNAASYFSTIRALHNINDQWSINLNSIFSRKQDSQQSFTQQSFLFDENTYNLSVDRYLALQGGLWNADLQVDHFSKNQERSLQLYIKGDYSNRFNAQNILEFDPSSVRNYFSEAAEKQQNWLAAGLFTQKISNNAAGQIQLKGNSFTRPQTLIAENEDFPVFFGQVNEWSQLRQSLAYSHQEMEITGRYLWSHKILLLEVEPIYALSVSRFGNNLMLTDSANLQISPYQNENMEDEVFSNQYKLNARVKINLDKKSSLDYLLQLDRITNRNKKDENTSFSTIQTMSSRVSFQRVFFNNARGLITYTLDNQNPVNEFYFSTPYFSDSYTFYQPDIRNRNTVGHRLSVNYNKRNELKLRYYTLNIKYDINQQIWRDAALFERSLFIVTPWFSNKNNGFSITGNFDQFIPKFKTNIKVGSTYSNNKGAFLIQNETSNLSNQALQLHTSFRSVFLRNFNVIIDNSMGNFQSYETGKKRTSSNSVFTWRTDFTTLYQINDWRVSFSCNRIYGQSDNNIVNLLGTQMKASKNIFIAKKRMGVELNVVNLLNKRDYSRVQNDSFFFFRSSIEAIPMFCLLKLDYSL
ncbi:MAG TPA: carboxypeptidase-like regulatory domain-containing protein [Saprospiraceae bacterium]|nr:carboxypeptidase-like regulatory domain-containing protein [Saprospiraceae bacterium]HMP23955.1 carboxypeptidase-like regulatory domain-containing protein [Saprospiraceae bacterium]